MLDLHSGRPGSNRECNFRISNTEIKEKSIKIRKIRVDLRGLERVRENLEKSGKVAENREKFEKTRENR